MVNRIFKTTILKLTFEKQYSIFFKIPYYYYFYYYYIIILILFQSNGQTFPR